MNITLTLRNNKTVNLWTANYHTAKQLKFVGKYKGLVKSICDRLGNKI